MKATIVKLPARYVVIMGDGDYITHEFGRSGYQAAEIAKAYGVTETVMGSVEECLKFTQSSRS